MTTKLKNIFIETFENYTIDDTPTNWTLGDDSGNSDLLVKDVSGNKAVRLYNDTAASVSYTLAHLISETSFSFTQKLYISAPTSTPSGLLDEDFESYAISTDMTGEGWTWNQYAAESASFNVIAGKYGEIKAAGGGSNWGGGFLYTAGTSWTDYTVEFDVISFAARLIFGVRAKTGIGAYYIQTIPTNSYVMKCSSTAFPTSSAIVDTQTCPASITHVKVIVSGTNIKVYYNGSATPTHDYTDSTYTEGTFAFSCYQGGQVIDNLEIYSGVTDIYQKPCNFICGKGDLSTGYKMVHDAYTDTFKLLKGALNANTGTELVSESYTYSTDTWITLTGTWDGETLTLSIDGTPVCNYTDPSPLDPGYIGLQLECIADAGFFYADDYSYYTTVSLTLTNSDYMKRSQLYVNTFVTFYLNMGNTLDSGIDITNFVVNLGDISETLSKSEVSSGGVILPSLSISLNNESGKWNRVGEFFKNGFVNNSMIEVETFYYAYVYDEYQTIAPSFKYKGLLKVSNCEWNVNNFRFKAMLSSLSSILSNEQIRPATLSVNSFNDICLQILNRDPFTKYLTISESNWEFGYDDTNIVDSPTEWVDKKVKDVLDEIMLISNSIYYIDYDGNFIIEPAVVSSPSSLATFRGDDIYKIESQKYDWSGHITAWTWDDGENDASKKIMSYPDREIYQYDYRIKNISSKAITVTATREAILEYLLSTSKWIKKELQLECKWHPEIIINSYILLDIPDEAIYSDDNFIWNDSQWNDGKKWSIAQKGFTISSSKYWKVIDIDRSSTGEKMKLTLLEHTSEDQQ